MATHEAIRHPAAGRVVTRIPGTRVGNVILPAVLYQLPKITAVKGTKGTGQITVPPAPIGPGFATDAIVLEDQDGTIRNFIFYNGGPLPPLGPDDVIVNTGGGFDADAVAQNLVNAINGEAALGVQATLGVASPFIAFVQVVQSFAGSNGNTTILHTSTATPDPRIAVVGFSGGTDGFIPVRYMRRIASRVPGNPNQRVRKVIRRLLRRRRT